MREVKYDFRSARERAQMLKWQYIQAKRQGDDMAAWALAAEIEEIEKEIAEAHKRKMAALCDQRGNIITPIVQQWQWESKEEVRV